MTQAAPLREDITGLVLAGGRGQRMQGADKGLVAWRGRPLARHALDRLRPQVGTVAVNANRNHAAYAAWNVPVWPDRDDSRPGPLAGLLAGLHHCGTGWLACVPCDSPLFPPDLVARLAEGIAQSGAPLAMAASPGATGPEAQPVFLLLRRELRPALEQAIAAGEHRVGRWAQAQGAALVLFDDAAAFANANTPQELAALGI